MTALTSSSDPSNTASEPYRLDSPISTSITRTSSTVSTIPVASSSPHQYRFPFADSIFSFVFLTSVFTHMLCEGVEQYLNEIQRVLLPRGRSFITFFLLNEESEDLMRSNRSH